MASFVSVTVLSKESERAFLLIGPPCCCTAAVNGDTLLIVQFDLLTLISLPEGQILQQKVIDCPGGCLGIYPLGEDWLIHAEDAIIRLDRKLQLLWHRCGADIFVSVDGGDSVTLTEDRILLRDFQDNHYELDFQGNLIEFIEKASV